MAKIKTLRVHGSGEALHPRTSASAVTLADGTSLDTEVERLRGKQEAFKDSDDIAVGADGSLELSERAKLRLFIDMFNSAAMVNGRVYGKYDPENAPDAEHPFMLNKLWLTYAEAVKIMKYAPLCASGTLVKSHMLAGGSTGLRTVMPINCRTYGDGYQFMKFADSNIELEAVCLDTGHYDRVVLSDMRWIFGSCTNLREITGVLDVSSVSAANLAGAFNYCLSLEEVRITRLNKSLSLEYCPLISLASMQYLVENAVNTAAITITVNANVYAKLADTANAEWHALVGAAAEKNITFAKP